MSEWIEGTVARVIWAAPDSDYAVVSLDTEDGFITAVGQLGLVLGDAGPGAFIAIEGNWGYTRHTVNNLKQRGFYGRYRGR